MEILKNLVEIYKLKNGKCYYRQKEQYSQRKGHNVLRRYNWSCPGHLKVFYYLFVYFFKDFMYLFLEKGREGER